MKKISLSKRIALYFMTATAVLTIIIFLTIYWVVYSTVTKHLHEDVDSESLELFNSIVVLSDQVVFANQNEWLENEHGQIEVNPTFIQFADSSGNVIKKSPNLMDKSLRILKYKPDKVYFNDFISESAIYQLQVPIKNAGGDMLGYLSVALPLEESMIVLRNLRMVLIIAFPIVLIFLYVVTNLIARKSISPVYRLTESAKKITHENFKERIELPARKDELYTLTETINSLVNRLQGAVLREKQFTSDASHELRTPLSILRGTFEVMLRKPRDMGYYEEKIKSSLNEVNRMSVMVEQLLLLARYESGKESVTKVQIRILDLVHELVGRLHESMNEKLLALDINIPDELIIESDHFMISQILENLLTNAIKYSLNSGTIHISTNTQNHTTTLLIRDEGTGMSNHELEKIFERFYRTDSSRNSIIGGNGLGLSIVKRFTDLLSIGIAVKSQPGKGTEFALIIS